MGYILEGNKEENNRSGKVREKYTERNGYACRDRKTNKICKGNNER